MFRAIRNLVAQDVAGFEDRGFAEEQRQLYQESIPNMFYVQNKTKKDALREFNDVTGVVNPLTRTVSNIPYNVGDAAQSLELSSDIITQLAACETATLDGLIQNQDPSKGMRCGWIYKNGPAGPTINRGVLGTKEGPMSYSGVRGDEGKYYWNLLEAQKAVAGDLCASLTDCQSVQDPGYVGKCAFDPIRGRGVPIFPNGSLMFPTDATMTANPQSLIRSRDACPPPPAPGTPAYNFQQTQGRDVCAQLPNGTFSRDCMLAQVKTGGCSDNGALALALTKGTLTDYSAGLSNNRAYEVYQARTRFPLIEGAIKDGSVGLSVALDNFKALATEAKKSSVSGLQAAARDLCLESGAIDRFDFCSELTDTTPPPYSLECLRREWTKRGGTPAGRLYPTESTIGNWNAIQTWGGVQRRMSELAREAQKATYAQGQVKEPFDNTGALIQLETSHVPTGRRGRDLFEPFTDRTPQQSQTAAMLDFYGIQRQPIRPNPMPYIVGVETYWFNRTNNTFLGRVLSSNPPKIDTRGIIPIVNAADNVQLIMISNLRPADDMSIQIGAVTDDGVAVMLNKNYEKKALGTIRDGTDEFSRYYAQGVTEHTNKVCWNLVRVGPNVVVADWFEQVGGARFDLFYRDCGKAQVTTRKEFPAGIFSLTQEPEAPFLDFHYRDGRLVERRLAAAFEARATGGAQADAVRGAVRLMRNGAVTLPTPIAASAWRSVTLRFVCYAVPVDRQVFYTYGSMFQIYMEGGKMVVKFTGPNLTRSESWAVNWVRGETYVLYINMRSSFEGQHPDIFSVALLTEAEALRGADPAVRSLRTGRGEPLYNQTDSYGVVLGSTDAVSVDFGVQRLRFFDYELKGGDLKRDAEDKWLRLG